MDCTQGSGLSYTWTGGFAATSTTQQVSGNITATTTFTATASNAGGSSTKSATVTVATGGGPLACAGFLNTNVFTATWPYTANATLLMGVLDAGIVKFTTGSGTGTGLISLSTAGNNAATTHDYTLSTQPCDFGPGRKQFVAAGAPAFRMTVSNTVGNYPNLLPNTTYYINIRNNAVTGCAATGQPCDIFPINLQGPQ
jgi:hypothetical protein